MAEYTKKSEKKSKTIESNPKTPNQTSILNILQTYKGGLKNVAFQMKKGRIVATLTVTFDVPPQIGIGPVQRLQRVYANVLLAEYKSHPPFIDYDSIATEIGVQNVLAEYPNAVNIQVDKSGQRNIA